MRRHILTIALAALGCSRLGTDPSWTERDPGASEDGVSGSKDSSGSSPEVVEFDPVTGQPLDPPSRPATGTSVDDERPSDGAQLGEATPDPQATPGEQPPGAPAGDPTSDNPDDEPQVVIEPGRLPAHHLTASEYNTTVAQLLATDQRPADYFPASGSSEFDANVGVLASLSPVLVQGYYDAAKELAAAAMNNATSRAQALDCDPATVASESESECVTAFVEGFGLRAFRRPLQAEEVARYVASYDYARAELMMDASAATEHVLRILLSSPNFFLRIEATMDGVDTAQSEAFALATRLSYLLWSSAPDQQLLDQAQQGSLSSADDILREVNRLLDDERSSALLRDFIGQWLGLRRLPSHDVNTASYPQWNAEVLSAMGAQAEQFVSGLFRGERHWADFLSAQHPDAPALSAVLADDPATRAGFLTLPAFLTLSSHGDRTAPTTRATTVLGGLLCTTIRPPANVDIPDLSAAGEGTLGEANIRRRLEEHRAAEECAGCHSVLDPIGLSLEHYDAIGHYRTQYGDGSEVDASGEYSGVSFDAVEQLVPVIAADQRFATCPVEKLTSYALRRSLGSDDRDVVTSLAADWASGSLDDLLRRVTTHEMFSPQL